MGTVQPCTLSVWRLASEKPYTYMMHLGRGAQAGYPHDARAQQQHWCLPNACTGMTSTLGYLLHVVAAIVRPHGRCPCRATRSKSRKEVLQSLQAASQASVADAALPCK